MPSDFTYIEQFINSIDVICPDCSKRALVNSNPANRAETRLICGHCGLSKMWIGNPSVSYSSPKLTISSSILLGQPVDCYFKIPLWYTAQFKGEVFFAYNQSHLHFLGEIVSNKLRKRKQNEHGWSNGSLESRLPKWMLMAKNRAVLTKKIAELLTKN